MIAILVLCANQRLSFMNYRGSLQAKTPWKSVSYPFLVALPDLTLIHIMELIFQALSGRGARARLSASTRAWKSLPAQAIQHIGLQIILIFNCL